MRVLLMYVRVNVHLFAFFLSVFALCFACMCVGLCSETADDDDHDDDDVYGFQSAHMCELIFIHFQFPTPFCAPRFSFNFVSIFCFVLYKN